MECNSLRALRANARKTAKFINQLLNRTFVHLRCAYSFGDSLITFAPNSLASSAAPLNELRSLEFSTTSSATDAFVVDGAELGLIDGSIITSILRSRPTTSIKASRRISSLLERKNESRAPTLIIATVIADSSTVASIALALSKVHVRRRRPLTFSITSGHKRRRPTTSIPSARSVRPPASMSSPAS